MARPKSRSKVQYLNPEGACPAQGLYSHVGYAPAGATFYVAGQLSVGAKGEVVGKHDFDRQFKQVFANLGAVLKGLGARHDDITKFTTYLVHSQDIEKFMRLLLRRNGYVLEQLLSPLVVQTTPEHAELCELAKQCVTHHHGHHYLGFAKNQWRLFRKEERPRVKPLLYVYRVLLTGLHLMRKGEVTANLVTLNEEARLPYVAELIAAKQAGESAVLPDADLPLHEREFTRLLTMLDEARLQSHLPDAPTAEPALSDLLMRLRLATL